MHRLPPLIDLLLLLLVQPLRLTVQLLLHLMHLRRPTIHPLGPNHPDEYQNNEFPASLENEKLCALRVGDWVADWMIFLV